MIILTVKHRVSFQIDDIDYDSVSKCVWHIDTRGYPSHHNILGEPERLHIFLMGDAPIGLVWDHENRDKLDNRRYNLRYVTQSVNNTNKAPRGNTGYKGIHLLSNFKYHVDIYVPHLKKTFYLGRLSDLEEAIALRQRAEDLYGVNELAKMWAANETRERANLT